MGLFRSRIVVVFLIYLYGDWKFATTVGQEYPAEPNSVATVQPAVVTIEEIAIDVYAVLPSLCCAI